ncbi:unnamed protein product [Linum trigynum]|uniref:Ubiquitin-like domain-containing protein n=1 Tax=Linum trigynum TaxID=586398 RepID=A0AAV2D617_9ROSI
MSGIRGTTNLSEEKKPNVDRERIDLKVTDQEGKEMLFKIWRDSPLNKLMNAYCEQRKVVPKTYVFLYDGQIIHPLKTPDELEMENGAEIAAMLHQTGGCSLTKY